MSVIIPKIVSEITINDIAGYLRLLPSDIDNDVTSTLLSLKDIAVAYASSYTGLTADELDDYPDMVIVIYMLVQDMFDNRSLCVEKAEVNQTVSNILNMHSRNFL